MANLEIQARPVRIVRSWHLCSYSEYSAEMEFVSDLLGLFAFHLKQILKSLNAKQPLQHARLVGPMFLNPSCAYSLQPHEGTYSTHVVREYSHAATENDTETRNAKEVAPRNR